MQTVTHIKRLCWKSTHFLCNDDFNKCYVKTKDFPEGKVTQTFNTKLYDALEFEGGKKQKHQLHKTFNVCLPIPPFRGCMWTLPDLCGCICPTFLMKVSMLQSTCTLLYLKGCISGSFAGNL